MLRAAYRALQVLGTGEEGMSIPTKQCGTCAQWQPFAVGGVTQTVGMCIANHLGRDTLEPFPANDTNAEECPSYEPKESA